MERERVDCLITAQNRILAKLPISVFHSFAWDREDPTTLLRIDHQENEVDRTTIQTVEFGDGRAPVACWNVSLSDWAWNEALPEEAIDDPEPD